MSAPISASRETLKALIEAYAPLAGVPVFIERKGADIDEDIEAALNARGLAIIVLESVAGVADQLKQGPAVLSVTVVVCLLENVVRNMADADATVTPPLPAGFKIGSEDAVFHILKAVVGQPCGNGDASLSRDVFARGGDDAGLIEHYIGIVVPIIMR